MSKERELKTCFVICPIGDEGTDIRKRSDQVLEYIIAPAVKECGYEPIRADEISKPGNITFHVLEHVINDDLVIADLTGHNPNVFYELGIRDAFRKPVIPIIASGESIPFDISHDRAIFFDYENVPIVIQKRIFEINNTRAGQECPAYHDRVGHSCPTPASISNMQILFWITIVLLSAKKLSSNISKLSKAKEIRPILLSQLR